MCEVKIKRMETDLNCDRCWCENKGVVVLEVNGNEIKLCPKCYHEWRKERKIMPDSEIPAYNLLINAFDLLMDVEKLETLLANLSETERNIVYAHPILKEYDLLP